MRECSQVSIMESEFFNFEPSEFQVLEEIDFDETIERPEKVRFFTLEEQTVDAFERLLPKGRVTKYQIKEIEKQVERLKELYNKYVIVTVDDYKLREPDYRKKFSWVYPVYAFNEFEYTTYDFASSWAPLYDSMNQPNYYPRMLTALPKPVADAPNGTPLVVLEPTETLNADGTRPHRILPDYVMTRTQRHDNGSMSIVHVPVESTGDRLSIQGYYLAKRPLDIPNPLLEHPFLKGNEPTFVETGEPLSEVAPSLDAILTHAVPVTKDPYREAQPYLKLYDIRLQDIPWSSWKAKFPPVQEEPAGSEMMMIDFPKPQEFSPSEKLVEEYRSAYHKGVSSRKWLMEQLDGGSLVIQMLMSQAIDNGSVATIPGIDMPLPSYPDTSLDECTLIGKSFQEFVVQGSLRKTDKKLECVPLEFVKQERSRMGYVGRIPWKETTGVDMLETYRKRLALMHPIQLLPAKPIGNPVFLARKEAPLRKEVLLVQNDVHRFQEDKLRDVQDLLRGTTTLTNNIYSDAEGGFVLCGHTLATLSGDFAADKDKFFETWTSKDDGFRVCKFCGEFVSMTDFVNQADFDEDGFVMNKADALQEKVFHADSIAGFTTGLRALQPLFQLDNAMDSTTFLLLSILQVLPSADAVDPILKFARGFLVKQYGNKDTDEIRKIKGIVGILVVITLLQTHTPRILPRRAFGPRPLYLHGYPRDLPEPEDYSIIDTIMMVIRKTFEAYPTSFKGPSQAVIRSILSKPKDVRKNAVVLMDKVFLAEKTMKALFAQAKRDQETMPPVEQPRTLLPVLLPAPTAFGTQTNFTPCPSARPILRQGEVAKVVQSEPALRRGIRADTNMKVVTPSVSARATTSPVPTDAIRSMFKKKSTTLRIGDDYRTNVLLASRLADMFLLPQPLIPTLSPSQKADELRDIGKGLVYEVLQQIQADPIKRGKLEEQKTKDVTLYMLLADAKEEKVNVNKLRAQERLRFVDEMGRRSDQEREILQELLRIGVAPYIITNKDREVFAQEAQQLADVSRVDIETLDNEIGVGQPADEFDQGEIGMQGNEGGNYGDYNAQPVNDGRDHVQQSFWDDDRSPI